MRPRCSVLSPVLVLLRYMRATGGSSRVMCDNVPGLVSRQRQLCHRHPDVMRAIGLGVAEWTAECQHQFRQHRWNCNTLDRDHSLFGRVLLRSKSPAFTQLMGSTLIYTHPYLVFRVPAHLVLHAMQSEACSVGCHLSRFTDKDSRNQETCLSQVWEEDVVPQAGVFFILGSVHPRQVTTLPVPPGSDFVSRRKDAAATERS